MRQGPADDDYTCLVVLQFGARKFSSGFGMRSDLFNDCSLCSVNCKIKHHSLARNKQAIDLVLMWW